MTKYVIAEFSESYGLSQMIVKAESKLHALQYYFGVGTDTEGPLYLNLESLVADMGYELGFDINIIKVGKKPKDDELQDKNDYQVDFTPWPFPTKRP
jgi:hypothetical protein